jgi:type VI secretion system protein ImpJ
MKFMSRVVRSEGMYLGPHHFQTQSRYFENALWFLNSNLRQLPGDLGDTTLDLTIIMETTA